MYKSTLTADTDNFKHIRCKFIFQYKMTLFNNLSSNINNTF